MTLPDFGQVDESGSQNTPWHHDGTHEGAWVLQTFQNSVKVHLNKKSHVDEMLHGLQKPL